MGNNVPGSLHVANDVIADIIGNAAMSCYGVVGMTAADSVEGIISLLPMTRLRKGIEVSTTPQGAHIDLHIVVEYGTNASVVAKNLVDRARFVLEEYTKVPIEDIVVHVEGVKRR